MLRKLAKLTNLPCQQNLKKKNHVAVPRIFNTDLLFLLFVFILLQDSPYLHSGVMLVSVNVVTFLLN